jgi:small-conductance mechanosensitive channel
VILAVAGYFSMVAPNGIRVGDRVSLQGPFTYVHGEVIEIGLVRIRLRELAADTLEPTGRIVVFPNSVVFTGSFFKHPPAQAKAA